MFTVVWYVMVLIYVIAGLAIVLPTFEFQCCTTLQDMFDFLWPLGGWLHVAEVSGSFFNATFSSACTCNAGPWEVEWYLVWPQAFIDYYNTSRQLCAMQLWFHGRCIADPLQANCEVVWTADIERICAIEGQHCHCKSARLTHVLTHTNLYIYICILQCYDSDHMLQDQSTASSS